MIIIFIWMSLLFFGSTQSTSFQCRYPTNAWGTFDITYYCLVQNTVNITSLEAAEVDDISGTHQAGYNNDNVEGFMALYRGHIHYFPRGLNKFFKNLKGIKIGGSGFKEIHQSDLKDFPKLMELWLYSNNLEILEENLFEFNPNLEFIYMDWNKIKRIDSNVFDKLTKLKSLNLNFNPCINMNVQNNLTEVQKVIKAATTQCNIEYQNWEQKVRNLEIESKNLSLKIFNKKLKELENEIKNSKYSNSFFQRIVDLKADLNKREKSEFLDKISTLIKTNINEMSSALESKINNVYDKLAVQGTIMSEMQGNLTNISDKITTNNNNNKIKFLALIKEFEKIFSLSDST